jgi:lipopolysaccharide transport system ATP-binding protein
MRPIIKAEQLSKRYRIGEAQNSYGTVREAVVNTFRAPLERIKRKREASDKSTLWALRDISFEVQPGEVVGIIGRNGAGKSTLLKLLSRITEPTTGRAELYGRVGSLLEVGTGFHPELSGRENIYLNGAILGMNKSEIERRFDEIVAFAEMEKFLETPVKRYSSGMYMRLAFAVAAHLEPEILIIDEVLAVGDAAFQKKCLGKMSDVAKQGRTVLFVTHNMIAVKSLCTRALLLQGGRLIMDGESSEVVAQYFDAGRASKAEMVWTDDASAPGNKIFRLQSVRLRNEQGEVSSEVERHQSFNIEIEYRNLNVGAKLGATVVLFNQEGVCVFSSPSNHETNWHGKPRPTGLFRSTCQIPGSLLPDGRFSVSVLVWADNYQNAHREDGAVEFEIVESERKGDYFGGWLGVVRPELSWQTDLVEKETLLLELQSQ